MSLFGYLWIFWVAQIQYRLEAHCMSERGQDRSVCTLNLSGEKLLRTSRRMVYSLPSCDVIIENPSVLGAPKDRNPTVWCSRQKDMTMLRVFDAVYATPKKDNK